MLASLSGTLGPTLKRLLPLLLIFTFGMAIVTLLVTAVVPAARTYNETQALLEDAQAQLADYESSQDPESILRVMRRQLDSAQEDVTNAGDSFITDVQANELLERLYWYADRSGVQVTSLQTQQTGQAQSQSSGSSRSNRNATAVPSTSNAYDIRFIRLQVEGSLPSLIDYVVNLREASAPAVVIEALDLSKGDTTATLMMNITIYTSPYASGVALTALPQAQIAPSIEPPAVAVVLTEPPTPTLDASPTPEPTAVPTEAPTLTPTLDPTVPPTATIAPSATPPEDIVRLASAPEPPLTLLFEETFDTDPLYAWTIGAGWSLVNVANGRVLQATNANYQSVILRYSDVGDGVLELRFLLESGSARFRIRNSSLGSYTLEMNSSGALTLYRLDAPIQTMNYGSTLVGQWHDLRFSAIAGILRITIDSVEVMIGFDSLQLPPGEVAFQSSDGTLYVDDVKVWVPQDAG